MAQSQELVIGDDLVIRIVKISELREQDVNAQQMSSRDFDRLTENIRIRGQVESLPYCHQPNGEGAIEIISGHHRVRAARKAGVEEIPVIVDLRVMRRSEVVAKQIAHNELHGEPDEEILARLIAMIDNVDDLLMTGLDEDHLPSPENDDTKLLLPHAEFDWRMATFMFLPEQLNRVEDLASSIPGTPELLGFARRDQFEDFSKALVQYGQLNNIKNMAAVVDKLTQIAQREIADSEEDPALSE